MPDTGLARRILDTALQRAEDCGWEALCLHEVAAELDISLQQINRFYPQKDDLVEAWFDRADSAVLSIRRDADFATLSAQQRVYQVMMTWFETLAPHRRLTRQMLAYKFEPGHIHLQALGIMRISRTVQWFREAALLKTRNLCRIHEELSLSGAYLCSFALWLFDDADNRRCQRTLQRLLQGIPSLRE